MGFAVGIREIDVDGFHSCASGLQRFDLVGVIFHYGRVFTGKFHEWKPEVIDIVALSPFQHLKRTIVEKGFPYIRVGNFLIDSLYIPSSSHALGLYWLNEKGEFEWCDITGNGTENAAIEFNAGERMQDIYFTRSGKLKFYANLWGGGYQEQDSKGQYSMGYQAYPKVKYDDNGKLAEFPDCYAMAKGVTITFKKDQAFGFYIKVKGGTDCLKSKADETGNLPFMPSQANYDHIMFSQEDRNEFFGRVVFRDNTYYTKDEIEWYWDKVDEEGKPTSASNVLYRIKDPANEGNYLYENLTGYGWGEGFEKSFNGQAWRFHDFGDDVKNGFRSGERSEEHTSELQSPR